MFTFPFEVPADLSALSAEEFATFAALARENARTALADEAASPDALVAYRDLLQNVQADETRRTELATAAADARAQLAGACWTTRPRPPSPRPPRSPSRPRRPPRPTRQPRPVARWTSPPTPSPSATRRWSPASPVTC